MDSLLSSDFLFVFGLAFVWIFFVILFCATNAGMNGKLSVIIALALAVGFDISYALAHFFPSLPLLYIPPILLAAFTCFYLAFAGERRFTSLRS